MKWLHSFWQKAKKPLEIIIVTIVCLLVIALVVVIVQAYLFHVNVPGLAGKNIWDWLQLLIIPAVLAVGGYLFNFTTSRNDRQANEQRAQTEREAAEKQAQTERDVALDNQREAALHTYIDCISDLLLEKKLRESGEKDEVRMIARVRTITILFQLDARRIGYVFSFLRESGLMSNTAESIVTLKEANLSKIDLSYASLVQADLRGANLRGANLRGANLSEANLYQANLYQANLSVANLYQANLSVANLYNANLSGAYLSGANLLEANLLEANLSVANLYNANLSGAYLSGAYLSGANLSGAKVTEEQLKIALSLQGATLPDGSKHD